MLCGLLKKGLNEERKNACYIEQGCSDPWRSNLPDRCTDTCYWDNAGKERDTLKLNATVSFVDAEHRIRSLEKTDE